MIDLINVSFAGDTAPDRIASIAVYKELQALKPEKKWNLLLGGACGVVVIVCLMIILFRHV